MKKLKGRNRDIDISDTGRIILDDDSDRRNIKKKKKKREEVVELSLEEKREQVRNKGKFEIEKKKRKKHTVGEDIRKGKTKKVERKLDRLEMKTLAVMQKIQNDEEEIELDNLPMEVGKIAGEQDFFDEFNTIFSTTRKLLRRLEAKMLDPERDISSKDVYALCTMYSAMRETIGDMRSIKDMQAQAQEIENVIFAPLAKTVAGILIDMYHRFNRDLINNVKNPDQLATLQALFKDMIAETSSNMKSEFDNSASRVVSVLNGG